ncbi:MAG TPA: transketolase, partial [Bacteroidales bacterium]|nr:transketolase [Bacteroidales bacterium]
HVCLDCPERSPLQAELSKWMHENYAQNRERYSSHLYSESELSALKVKPIAPVFDEKSVYITGREILRDNYDKLFAKYPLLMVFGEDVGKIGGVNQTLEKMQEKYGELRVSDTGIREATILGQAIGLSMRGLRPIVEIQYFDYLLYGLQLMSDDLATVQYRTKGGQKAPAIISTRGHRLEGIWHSGSPLSMVINSIRGVYVCVPRNMTQAAGFYNTLLEADEPAVVIEPLNGYRLKEKCPSNLGEYRLPLGVPEILNEGTDITVVTYGACVKIAQEAVEQLKEFNISVELIDVQTLLPFDLTGIIGKSIAKTNRVLFFDEDVPGGATSFMMHKVLEEQNAFYLLDSPPKTLTGMEHRPAYSTDGDYFSNPNAEDVFETIFTMMHEVNPKKYPKLY